MKTKTSSIAYVFLFLLLAITLAYQLAGSASQIDRIFDINKHIQRPFELEFDNFAVTQVEPEAQRVGLAKGDIVTKLNGQALSGGSQWQRLAWQAHPGQILRFEARGQDGRTKSANILLQSSNSKISFGESVFWMFHMVVPLFCLLVGYWVVLARPGDLNAWLILFLLAFPEAFFPFPSANSWPGG